jgi:hypothetical protein
VLILDSMEEVSLIPPDEDLEGAEGAGVGRFRRFLNWGRAEEGSSSTKGSTEAMVRGGIKIKLKLSYN